VITLWRIGFRLWSAGQYAKVGGGGLLLLALIWLATGFSALFWIAALIVGAVLYGTRSTLLGVAAREGEKARLAWKPRS
jgi:hypothetical protein